MLNRILPLVVSLSIAFQTAPAQRTDFEFEKITSEVGLPHDIVQVIFKDSDGLMWFGTNDGLCSYDGFDVTTYKSVVNGTQISEVRAIGQRPGGYLWIGLNKHGMVLFDKYKKEFKEFEYHMAGGEKRNFGTINDIKYYEKEDAIYFATLTNGAYKFQFSNDSLENLVYASVMGINLDHDSLVIIANWMSDLAIYNRFTKEEKRFTINKEKFGLPDWVEPLFLQRLKDTYLEDNKLWLCTWNAGLILLEFNSQFTEIRSVKQFSTQSSGNYRLSDDYLRSISIDHYGAMWISTTDKLNRLTLNEKRDDVVKIDVYDKDYRNPYKLNSNAISKLYNDNSQILWIGTFGGGVNKLDFNKSKFKLLDQSYFKSFKSATINGVCKVHDDELWFSVQGSGLVVYNTKRDKISSYKEMNRFSSIVVPDELFNSAMTIQEIELSGRNYIIMPCRFRKFLILEYNKAKRELVDGQYYYFPVGRFYSYFVEKQLGEYWFGGNKGIYKFNVLDTTKSLCDFSNIDIKIMKFDNRRIQSQTYNSVVKDKNGTIWAGAAGGIVKIKDYNNDSITNYKFIRIGDSLHRAWVNTLFFDSNNTLWVGTKGMGLCSYNQKNDSFRRYTEDEGMLADGIMAIIEDDNNCLWASSNKGLLYIQTDSTGNVSMKNYVFEDGLQGNIFCLNSIHKSSDGTLYVGGYNGLNIVRPNKIKMHRNIPVTKLSYVTIFNEDLDKGERLIDTDTLDSNFILKLTHRDYGVKFGFTNYSYSNSHKNRFAYKLTGYEDKWRYVGATQRFAHFNNLDPREYTFLVKSSNSDGVWNEIPVSLQIKVFPPWWETMWFKIITVVFVILSGVAFYFYRVNNLRQQKRKLEKKVYERTIELESANVELTEQKEEILAQKEEIEQQAVELGVKSASLEEQFKIISHQKDEITNSLNRLEVLSDFGQKLTSSLNIEVINDMFYKYACNILTIDAFGVGLYHEEEKAIVYPYFYENGIKQETIVKQLKDKRSLSSWCFNHQQPVIINDIFSEYDKYVTELNHPETSKITQSRIHIPLTVEDKRIGLLVINAFPKNAYGEVDFKSIQTLASYISIALDNANAYKIIHKDKIRITESIDAAQNIQHAFLPDTDLINQYIESFVLFKPKDVVSGDFYWFLPIENDSNKPKDFFIAAVDCTGHGVPGAFISLIGNSLLNELINTMRIHNPSKVLTELNKRLKAWLKQEEGVNNDGMDIALCRVQETTDGYDISYAGAKRSLTFIKSNTKKGEVLAGSRYSIGGLRAIKRTPNFELKEIKLHKNDCIYLFTDGYTDQNSPDRTKFSIANLRELLGRIARKPMSAQQNILEEVLKDFQKTEKQRDDITVIGMRL